MVILIFRYLSDKDVFESYYKQHLTRRLLANRSVSKEAERVEYLPIEWHESFAMRSRWAPGEQGTSSPVTLHDISLTTIPHMREFANDTMLDSESFFLSSNVFVLFLFLSLSLTPPSIFFFVFNIQFCFSCRRTITIS